MSRPQEELKRVPPTTIDWRTDLRHTPLSGRTTDPQALKLDEAHELFYNGIRLARRGDLETGREQIAKAFLLNHRCMCVLPVQPDPGLADLALDFELLGRLMFGSDSLAANVVKIPQAFIGGSHEEYGQGLIGHTMGHTMEAIEMLMKHVELQPEVETSTEGPLGGYLRRTTLRLHRAELHKAMGNRELAIKDLTAALKIDPTFTLAREERAKLYAYERLKDHRTVHAEFKRIVSEVHEDHRENESNYAWLAFTVLLDHELGAIEDAKRYFEKSLRTVARNKELYGPCQNDGPPVLKLVKEKFIALKRNPSAERQRRELDEVYVLDGKQQHGYDVKESGRHVCVCCGKEADGKGSKELMICGRCEQVSYCSVECQRKDWKSHKVFCKAMAKRA